MNDATIHDPDGTTVGPAPIPATSAPVDPERLAAKTALLDLEATA